MDQVKTTTTQPSYEHAKHVAQEHSPLSKILYLNILLQSKLEYDVWNGNCACFNFGIFKRPKRIQIPHHLFWHFRADNTIPTICWSGSIAAADFKFILISSPYSSSGKHSKRLLHKAIRGFDCNERFWLENKWTSSSWGSAQALLWLVGQASTNTGCIHVICSRCWQWLAFFRKSSHFCLLT